MGRITRIKAFVLILSLSISASAETSNPSFSCTPEGKGILVQELRTFLKKQGRINGVSFLNRLCSTSPDGRNPCPIKITQDKVADFEGADKKRLDIIPVLACAAAHAEGPARVELNELQSRYFDIHRGKFYEGWRAIPPEDRQAVQKFEDFAEAAPSDVEDYRKRLQVFRMRLEILEKAPTPLIAEVKIAKDRLNQILQDAKTAVNAEGPAQLPLKSSSFFDVLSQRALRLRKADGARLAAMANEELAKSGLNMRFSPKSENLLWFLCSTTNLRADGCKMTSVSFFQGSDSCGSFGQISLINIKSSQWTIAATDSNYTFNAAEFIVPRNVVLRRGQTIVKFWPLPDGFFPVKLSEDLRTLYARAALKTDMRTIGYLDLKLTDKGAIQFVPGIPGGIHIKRTEEQRVNFRKHSYTLLLPCL